MASQVLPSYASPSLGLYRGGCSSGGPVTPEALQPPGTGLLELVGLPGLGSAWLGLAYCWLMWLWLMAALAYLARMFQYS